MAFLTSLSKIRAGWAGRHLYVERTPAESTALYKLFEPSVLERTILRYCAGRDVPDWPMDRGGP